jgi:PAS domain S-box-containing protein
MRFKPSRRTAVRLVAVYVAAATTWLFAWEWVSPWTVGRPANPTLLHLVSMAVFVAATGVLLYWLLRRLSFAAAPALEVGEVSIGTDELYRSLVDTAPDAIAVLDMSGKILLANEGAARLYGFASAGEMLGLDGLDLVTPMSQQAGHGAFEQAAGKGAVSRIEYEIVRPDGSTRDVEVSAMALRAGRDEAVAVVAYARDVTERKAADEALARSEEWYRALAEESPEVVFIVDREDRVLYVNRAAARTVGRPAEDIIGLRRTDIFPPSDESTVRQGVNLRRVFESGMPLRVEDTIRLGDEVRWQETSLAPLHGGSGEVVGVMGVAWDTTERKQAEADLKRYQLLSEVSRDIVLFVRYEDGVILDANEAATHTYGYEREEMLGMTVADLRAPSTRGVVRDQMAEAFEKGILFETEHLRKDGTGFPVEISSRGAVVDGTKVLVSVIRDITERRRLDQLKSDFVSMVSHELRTPITAIMGHAILLEREDIMSDPAAARYTVERIRTRCKGMRDLVDSLLEVVRIQSGGLVLKTEELDLAAVVCEAAETALARPGCEARLELAPDLPTVTGDKDRIRWAASCLLDNAAKYSPDGGPVTVRTGRDGDMVWVSVTDEGVGIPAEVLPRIFDRFTQADMSTTRSYSGFGMGLFIVRQIVEAHGGEVTVESEPGKGSTFTIRIPIAGPAGPPAGDQVGSRTASSEEQAEA